jgi:hypothetical protein
VVIKSDHFRSVLQSDGGHDVGWYFFLTEAVKDVRFASASVSDQDDCLAGCLPL